MIHRIVLLALAMVGLTVCGGCGDAGKGPALAKAMEPPKPAARDPQDTAPAPQPDATPPPLMLTSPSALTPASNITSPQPGPNVMQAPTNLPPTGTPSGRPASTNPSATGPAASPAQAAPPAQSAPASSPLGGAFSFLTGKPAAPATPATPTTPAAQATPATPTNPAPGSQASSDDTDVFESGAVGTDKKDYGKTDDIAAPVTMPIAQLFEQKAVLQRDQLIKGMRYYRAEHNGKPPASQAEFDKAIIETWNVKLPDPPTGYVYKYNPATGKLGFAPAAK